MKISNFCRALKNDKGFTLVELMVVLVIIGILVAIAVPIYNKTQDKAKETACQANLRILNGAAAQYNTEKALGENEDELSNENWVNKLVGEDKYILEKPTCPSGGTYTFEAGKFTCDKHPKTDSGGGTSG